MESEGKTVKCQVTVFISLVMMCLFALFCVLVESARTAGARWYLQTAACSAMDSVFSQYHRRLWDSYRLLFVEYGGEDGAEEDFARFLMPYLETENWYPMAYGGASVQEMIKATEGAGEHLEQEILDYMKYGAWKLDFDENTAGGLMELSREATAVREVAKLYRGHSKEALRLEKSLEDISRNIKQQEEEKQEGLSRLGAYDGPGFRRSAGRLVRELNKVPGLVATYGKRADDLARGLEKSRAEYEAKRGGCSGQTQGLLEQEIREYESYTAQDGERRGEIEALESLSRDQAEEVGSLIEDAEEVERIIEEWEDEEEDGDGGGPDLEALWSPVEHGYSQIAIKPLSFTHGVKDKEKEGWLNQVESMYREGLLTLVVPEGTEVSGKAAQDGDAPSGTEMPPAGSRGAGIFDRLMVNQYCGMFFKNFRTGEGEAPEGGSGTGLPAEGADSTGPPPESGPEDTVLGYEVEYLIAGKDSDRDNLTDVVHRLLAVREGLNLMHILSDGDKRSQARSLAMAVTGAASVTPLLLVVTFFVMSVWALGEALMDVRGLLAGRGVALVKTPEDWTLQIDRLLTMGRERAVEDGGREGGLSYLSWLKILLLTGDIVTQEYRMMDLIQLNLMLRQPGFRMGRCVYQLRIKANISGKHVFFSPAFVENLVGGDSAYTVEVVAERVY